jgi:hypothetical protein
VSITEDRHCLQRRKPGRHGLQTGIKEDALSELTPKQQDVVLRLLARISEASYRRGAQQGAHIHEHRPHRLPKCLGAWRYDINEDLSPWLDEPHRTEPAPQRLDTEYWYLLRYVGLYLR